MAAYNELFQKGTITTVVKYSVLSGITYYAVSWFLKYINPWDSDHKKIARQKAAYKLKLLGKNKVNLSRYELLIASHLVLPSDIDVSWKDIAGLESILEEINETIIFPITKAKYLTNSRLVKPPKGVLLYGPPGCGKTMIAKATAKASIATFINLDISVLTDKWYGESQKIVSAVFSLAEKLEPAIIFIDEIDSLLRVRDSHDHEATAMIKSQFMSLWDGLNTSPDKIVIVMGATNRPQDIDAAILRRMQAQFKVSLPNAEQREEILKLILAEENTDELDYEKLANCTAQFSGSELKEVCRLASLCRFRELARKMAKEPEDEDTNKEQVPFDLRPITMEDLESALNSIANQK